MFVAVMFGMYAFLGICNWKLNLGEWSGFSRFVFASVSLITFFYTISENHDVAVRHRQAKHNEKGMDYEENKKA
jgi:hypothetical protein